jgi:hypothetical protein
MLAELSGDFDTWPRHHQEEFQKMLRTEVFRAYFAELERAIEAKRAAFTHANLTTDEGLKTALGDQGQLIGQEAFLGYFVGVRDVNLDTTEDESAG